MSLGPGDFVECLASERAPIENGDVIAGRIYCIEDMITLDVEACGFCGSLCDGTTLILTANPHVAWCAKRFRPIYRRKPGLFVCQPQGEPA